MSNNMSNLKLEIMKAIVTNVRKESNYSKFNGLTFEVVGVLSSLIALSIPDECGKLRTVDFSFNEVFIVDFEKELQKQFDIANWYGGQERVKYANMESYKSKKEIICETTYNCPA